MLIEGKSIEVAALNRLETDNPIELFDSEGRPRRHADVLVDIGRQHTLFHAPDGTAFAQVGAGSYEIESRGYREVLAERFFRITEKGANRSSVADAVATLVSLAKFNGATHPVFLRVGSKGNHVIIDMGRKDWRAVEVGPDGWTWCATPPMFRRPSAASALPEPAAPDFSRLWRYVNVRHEHRPLVAGFMLAALCPKGPYPILFLSGEQGTGKSTFSRLLRKLTDPSACSLRAAPKHVRDLLVGALNGWVLALDNLSYLDPQLSDALCRLATGGAISERSLYTNTEEVLIDVQRPVIVNGIEDLAVRPDLAERGLHIELEVISNRMSEKQLWKEFDTDAPHIFGALLDGLSASIRGHEGMHIEPLPRMADFALWAAAGMAPLGFTSAQFIDAYRASTDSGLSVALDSSVVGRTLLAFMRTRNDWQGSAYDLLKVLHSFTDEATIRSPSWPKSERPLSAAIRRLAPALRQQGIQVDTPRTAQARLIVLRRTSETSSSASSCHPTSDEHDANDDGNPIGSSADAYRRARAGE